MPKASSKGKKFYAVQKGHQNGVFLTWAECEKQTKGYPGAKYKSFANAADAEAFASGTLPKDHEPSAPSTSSSSVLVAMNSKGKKRALSRVVADELDHDVVYCDGACKGNGKAGSIAGVGVWWGEDDPRNIAERCPGDQTNNRAELIAIVRMLETTPKSKRTLLIKTDSQYSIKCFRQWLPIWKRNNFQTARGQPVKNVDIIVYVSALLDARALVGQPVRMEYVKGHSGDRGNDGADAQANKGALLPPMPERDWAKAKQELLERLKEERKMNESQPTSEPLDANDDVLEQPRKVRKISHHPPVSRLSSTPEPNNLPTDSLTAQVRSPSPPCLISPLPIIEVSPSPPREIGPSQKQTTPATSPASGSAQVEPEPENVKVMTDVDPQLSEGEQNKPPMALDSAQVEPEPEDTKVLTDVESQGEPNKPPMASVSAQVESEPEDTKVLTDVDSQLSDGEPNKPPMASNSAQVEPEPENTKVLTDVDSQLSEYEPNKPSMAPKTPVRKHGVGLFTLTPPPNASIVRKFSTLPRETQRIKKSKSVPQLVPQDQENSGNPIVMCMEVVDVDSNESMTSEPVPQDQEANENPVVMSADAANVDLNDVKKSESVAQDQEEEGKTMAMSVDAADELAPPVLVENVSTPPCVTEEAMTKSDLAPKDQETNEKPIMSVEVADNGLTEAKESNSIPKDQEETEQSMAINDDAADLGLKVEEAEESDLVPTGQEEIKDSVVINKNAKDVGLKEAKDSESVQNDQEKTETPMVMSLDAPDVDLTGVTEMELVRKDEENSEISMTMSPNAEKVDLAKPPESEPVPNDEEKIERQTEKLMAMSVNASDVNLNDYLDCVDDDDDPFDDL